MQLVRGIELDRLRGHQKAHLQICLQKARRPWMHLRCIRTTAFHQYLDRYQRSRWKSSAEGVLAVFPPLWCLALQFYSLWVGIVVEPFEFYACACLPHSSPRTDTTQPAAAAAEVHCKHIVICSSQMNRLNTSTRKSYKKRSVSCRGDLMVWVHMDDVDRMQHVGCWIILTAKFEQGSGITQRYR